MIPSRSLVNGFLTKVKIDTQNHQSAHKFKYGTSPTPESKASQLAQKDTVTPTPQKDPPQFSLHEKIRRYCTRVSTLPGDHNSAMSMIDGRLSRGPRLESL